MPSSKDLSALTDEQIENKLAEFMGFPGYADGCIIWFDNQTVPGEPHENHTPWHPLESWSDLRQVEEKIMEDEELLGKYIMKLWFDVSLPMNVAMLKAPLRPRCLAALLAASQC